MEEKIMLQYADQYNEDILFQEYEEIQQSGMCNMFDFLCVENAAYRMGFEELVAFLVKEGKKGYTVLLTNYSALCEKYKI